MNETLAATLGKLQAQIYWLHDAEEFTELVSAANISLFMIPDFSRTNYCSREILAE